MFMRNFHLCAALLSLIIVSPAAFAADKNQELCAKAEQRYIDMFGRPSAEEEEVIIVKMYKYRFCPEHLTVPVGTTVRWVNVDKRTSHTVLLKEENTSESDRLFPEESFEFTFLAPGVQNYLCGPHWETQNMIGMVTVKP